MLKLIYSVTVNLLHCHLVLNWTVRYVSFIKQGQLCFQSQMKQVICCFVRHVIDGRCAWCFWTHYPVCVTWLSSELGKIECQLNAFFMNSLRYWHNSTFPWFSGLSWIKASVYSGRDRWQGQKFYTEGVSTVQTCPTASEASEICCLLCPHWHYGSYSHTVRFLAEHLACLLAAMKDLLCSKNIYVRLKLLMWCHVDISSLYFESNNDNRNWHVSQHSM